MWVEPAAGLRRDGHLVADPAFVQHFCDALLAEAVTVHVGGVDEIDAGIERGPDRFPAFLCRDIAPISTDVPGSSRRLSRRTLLSLTVVGSRTAVPAAVTWWLWYTETR